MPRTTQWLNSNKYRTYPFVEDSVKTGSDGFSLPDAALLDVAAVVYEASVTVTEGFIKKMVLRTVEVTESAGVKTMTFTFKYATALIVIAVPETSAFPFVSEVSNSATYRATFTFGVGVAEIAEANAVGVYNMHSPPYIEPALIVVQDNHRVNSISTDGGDILTGDIYLEEGYNCSIAVIPGLDEVRISAVKGAGAGIPCDPLDPEVVLCSGVLLRVNGLQAGEEGGFRIYGSNGVEVIPDPDNNQIIIRSRGDLSNVTCED